MNDNKASEYAVVYLDLDHASGVQMRASDAIEQKELSEIDEIQKALDESKPEPSVCYLSA